ncbi:metallophosphoesterase [Roseivirga seohaensis]|uniref:metallophosphoesterase n=1 Tax=Roseivirga seohaensis TaxID=1914963 RepID=UPI00069F92AE|nr:metallophosphoesterase [Roseivirga seohaensis]
MKSIVIITLSLFLFATSVYGFQEKEQPIYSVFLVGDAGEPGENPVLDLLKIELDKVGDRGAVLFLGDNIYPQGMPPRGHKLRPDAEIAIDGQINAVKDFQGKKFFVPGNHDWAQGRPDGFDWLKIQEKYVEDKLDSQDVWVPTRGCPGPVEVDLNENITLIVVDTQWFLHRGDKPAEGSDCEAITIVDVMANFQDALKRNAHKKVIVASHHPKYTYGIHGGIFSLKDHIFPLTASSRTKNLYIPLPVLGSIYPLYRKWFGNIQDTAHPVYRQFRDAMVLLMKNHPDIVDVAGHEHALQHIKKEGIDFIVSGSGSKNNAHVKQKGDALFATNTVGYGRLDYYSDGKTELKFITPADEKPSEIYSKVLSEKPFKPAPANLLKSFANVSFAGKDTLFAASELYHERSNFHLKMFGENYRNEWATKINVPFFDIGSEKGGLKIIKRGGGHQTISLRLEAADGKQYVLRSMDKNPALTLPQEFRQTFIKDIVQDGISASHPYAPFIIPTLADAAGIFHANPKVVYIPDDPRFGIHRQDFANTLALFEERANKKNIEEPFFGEGDDVLSSPDLYEKLRKDNDNHVDQVFVARNRLFDFWLGDWDRHDDQWRWVEYDKKDDEKLYKPIPRDRDVAFFAGEGIFKKIASSKWAQPALRGFHDDIDYMPSMGSYRIRYFDRIFMTEVSMGEWLEQARELKAALTDEIIESSIRQWPNEIYDLHGEEIIRKLKNRRDNLEKYAKEYYLLISKEVDILASDKQELFKVERLDDEHTKVVVHKISKKGNLDKIIYERTFKTSETDEIRLFGFDGNDRYEITGEVNKGIKVRIIAGDDDDVIIDNSKVRGLGKKTIVYDTKSGTDLETSSETRDLTTDKDPNINAHNRQEFDFNLLAPLVSVNYNSDDGLFLGGGVLIKTDGFRKSPYATKHKISGNYAVGTSSYQFSYDLDVIDAFGKLDFALSADAKAPNFVNNFFGMGNETPYDKDIEERYYRTRFEEYSIRPTLTLSLGKGASINFGPTFRTVEVEESTDRFINDFANTDPLGASVFEQKVYAGGTFGFHFNETLGQLIPKTGLNFNAVLDYNAGFNSFSGNSAQLKTDASFRWSFREPSRTVFATRMGYQKVFGDYEFFQSAQLDGFSTLRGYRRFRFSGESSLYHQLEMRVKLFDWRSFYFPSQVGMILFNDLGRVWVDGESSNKIHHGYGGGLYVTPFNFAAINILLAVSEESVLPLVKFGFYF